MTSKEKLKTMHPEFSDDAVLAVTRSYCPFEMGIDYPPDNVCSNSSCGECWDQEIPGTEKIKKENNIMPTHDINRTTKMTKAELVEEIKCAYDHIHAMETQIQNLERYKQYEDMANEMKAMHTAFMNSGFTNEQAYDLLKTMTQAVVPAALRGM